MLHTPTAITIPRAAKWGCTPLVKSQSLALPWHAGNGCRCRLEKSHAPPESLLVLLFPPPRHCFLRMPSLLLSLPLLLLMEQGLQKVYGRFSWPCLRRCQRKGSCAGWYRSRNGSGAGQSRAQKSSSGLLHCTTCRASP